MTETINALAALADTVLPGLSEGMQLTGCTTLEGLDLPAAAGQGNVIGARVVGFPGDADGLPTRARLAQLQLQPSCAAHGTTRFGRTPASGHMQLT